MTTTLYILGLLLRHGSMHGYQIKQIIDQHISDFAQIKIGNIYYHLNSMKAKELVSAQVVSGKKSVDKTVYAITNSGEQRFNELLQDAAHDLNQFEFAFDSVLFFRENTDKYKLKPIIENKIETLKSIIKNMEAHQTSINQHNSEENAFYTGAIFSHHLVHYQTELAWYQSLQKEI